jgi:hypothetical protein
MYTVPILALVVAASACSKKAGPPPAPELFRAMTADEKCEATAPRATLCIDELLIASLQALAQQGSGERELADGLTADLRGTKSSDRQAADMHRMNCLGASDAVYAEAVVACWTVEGCEPFAACVTREEAKHPRAPVVPPLDGSSDAPP